MKNSDKVKRTIRISTTASELLNQLAKESGMTFSELVDCAIKHYGGLDTNESEDMQRIRKMFSKMAEQNYHMMNLMNSLITNLNYEDYNDAEYKPYKWLEISKNNYADSALKNQTQKLIVKNK